MLKAAILAVNLIVGGLGALGAYSVLYALEVDLPTKDEIVPYVKGDTIYLASNTTVHNNGLFEVDDVEISVKAELTNGTVLVDFHKVVGTIGTGEQTIPVEVPLRLADLVDNSWLIWVDAEMIFSVGVKAKYLYSLVDFEARHTYRMPWDRLVEEVRVDWNKVTYTYPVPDRLRLSIPYYARVKPVLAGLHLETSVDIHNDRKELIGTSSAEIVLAREMNDHIEVDFDREHTTDLMTRSQTLQVVISGFFAGQSGSVSYGVAWWAPLAGLLVTPHRGPNWAYAEYWFVNEASEALDLKITFVALNSFGGTILSTTDFKQVPGCPTHANCQPPPAPRQIGASDPSLANAQKGRVTFLDQVRGFKYEVEFPLTLRGGG
jgi:hypothetical protein